MQRSISKVRENRLEFYREKGKIHAKSTAGRFNTWRWSMVWLTQIVFYGACWLQWPGADGLRQAIRIDIVHERLYLFDLVLWPQDALLGAFALIFAATALFLLTALNGRIFCGFACPQTIYTMIFTWIEARIEGDHLARQKLDRQALDARKLSLKVSKHGLWLIVAAWTGITFVGYFTPIRELLPRLPTFALGPWEGFWLLFYGSFTYVQAGLAREAVCQHMCPYSRFQGVMFDARTKNVAYDAKRGEPRGKRRQSGENAAGDCIDCGVCIQVCPTGIDIRDGLQYQCINCGLCIDACDRVMQHLAAPPGLIRFAPEESAMSEQVSGKPEFRPRLTVYLLTLAIVGASAGWTLLQRKPFMVDVLRDRGALSRETAEGEIENAYTVKLMNFSDRRQDFRIETGDRAGPAIVGTQEFSVGAGEILPVTLTVRAGPEHERRGIQPIDFLITTRQAPGIRLIEPSRFAFPER